MRIRSGGSHRIRRRSRTGIPGRRYFSLYAIVLLFPLLLASAPPDWLTGLIGEMRRLTFAGGHRALGLLMPVILEELAMPHPKAALAWN